MAVSLGVRCCARAFLRSSLVALIALIRCSAALSIIVTVPLWFWLRFSNYTTGQTGVVVAAVEWLLPLEREHSGYNRDFERGRSEDMGHDRGWDITDTFWGR